MDSSKKPEFITDPKQVALWLEQQNIYRYTIKDNGHVTAQCSVNIKHQQDFIPVQFDEVTGSFYCNNLNLTTLQGCPHVVGKDFDCSGNNLESLEYCPRIIGRNFNFRDNKVRDLTYQPEDIGGDYDCSYNLIESLKGIQRYISGVFDCSNNNIDSMIDGPLHVYSHIDCSNNLIKNFEGFPENIIMNLDCTGNLIYSLLGIDDNIISICGFLSFDIHNIISGGLGLLLIDNMRAHTLRMRVSDDSPFRIIESYLGRPNEILRCQMELINSGFDDYAIF